MRQCGLASLRFFATDRRLRDATPGVTPGYSPRGTARYAGHGRVTVGLYQMAARIHAVAGSAPPGRTLDGLLPCLLDPVLIPSDLSLRFPLTSRKNVIDYISEANSLVQVGVQSDPRDFVAVVESAPAA